MEKKLLIIPIVVVLIINVIFSHQHIIDEENEFELHRLTKEEIPAFKEGVSFVFLGDISFSRGVERVIQRNNADYPLGLVNDYLHNSDVVFGNLETSIIDGPVMGMNEMRFRSRLEVGPALAKANISIVSLANNHVMDFGVKGLDTTKSVLSENGIKYVGLKDDNRVEYIEIGENRLAFLAYNGVEMRGDSSYINDMDLMEMSKDVKEAKANADIVIVSMHCGDEYSNNVSQKQRDFAHFAIDSGANLVIGHHPHVVQEFEEYMGGYIFYSLGNFLFDQVNTLETRKGLALKVYFMDKEMQKISLFPVYINDTLQPEILFEELSLTKDKRIYYVFKEGDYIDGKLDTIYLNKEDEKMIEKKRFDDANENGIKEEYALSMGKLIVKEGEKFLWESPGDWWIDDFEVADITGNGRKELNLSVWKSGSFGSSKPFWVEKDDPSVRNHFFVHEVNEDNVRQIWGSSNLPLMNHRFKIADIDNDGINDLVVIERNYPDVGSDEERFVAVWKWNGWGFTNEWRSEAQRFSCLEIVKNQGKNIVLVDLY